MDEEGKLTRFFRRWHLIRKENKVASRPVPYPRGDPFSGLSVVDMNPGALTSGPLVPPRSLLALITAFGNAAPA